MFVLFRTILPTNSPSNTIKTLLIFFAVGHVSRAYAIIGRTSTLYSFPLDFVYFLFNISSDLKCEITYNNMCVWKSEIYIIYRARSSKRIFTSRLEITAPTYYFAVIYRYFVTHNAGIRGFFFLDTFKTIQINVNNNCCVRTESDIFFRIEIVWWNDQKRDGTHFLLLLLFLLHYTDTTWPIRFPSASNRWGEKYTDNTKFRVETTPRRKSENITEKLAISRLYKAQ